MSKVCKHPEGTSAPHGLPGVYDCQTHKRFVAILDDSETVNGADDPDSKLSQVSDWATAGRYLQRVNPKMYAKVLSFCLINETFPGAKVHE